MSWTKMKLGDAATFINGYPFKPTDWKTEGKEIIRIQNLTGRGNDINYFDGVIPEKYKVRKGDLLISWSATLGIFEWDREDAWLNQHIFKVVFNKIEFDKSFFKHLISTVLSEFGQKVHGSTMKHITKVNFDKTIISLPPLPEQKRIAEILNKADALRQKNKQLLSAYDELLQSTFLDKFGDPATNPKGWKEVMLESTIQKIQIGPFGSQLHKADYHERGIPLINPTNIRDNKISIDEAACISEEKYNLLPQYHLFEGDVVMARRGDLSKVALVEQEGDKLFCGTGSLFIRFTGELNKFFLFKLLSHAKTISFLEKEARGVTMPNLNKGIIKRIPIFLPPINLQNNFARIVENIEAQKAIAKLSLKDSEDLFNCLVQKAFSDGLQQNI